MTSPVSPLPLAVSPAPVSSPFPAVLVPPTRLPICGRPMQVSEWPSHTHTSISPVKPIAYVCMNCVLPFSMNQSYDHGGLLAKRREQERAEEESTSRVSTVSAADLRLSSRLSSPSGSDIEVVPVSSKRHTETQAGLNSPRGAATTTPKKREEKIFTCTTCGTIRRNKRELTEHRRVHTGERPFSCTICGWNFKRKRELDSHNSSERHKKNEEKKINIFKGLNQKCQ